MMLTAFPRTYIFTTLILFSSLSYAQPPAFVISGQIQIDNAAREQVDIDSLINEGSLRFEIRKNTAYSSPSFSSSINDQPDFTVEPLRSAANSDIYMRITDNHDIYSIEDIYSPYSDIEDILRDGGNNVLYGSFLLTTINERYFRDMNLVRDEINHGSCVDAYHSLRHIIEEIVYDKIDLFYAPVQRMADLINVSFDRDCIPPFSIISYIFDIERMPSFQKLDELQKAEIYNQFARAIHKFPFKFSEKFDGHTVWETALHCYERAMDIFFKEKLFEASLISFEESVSMLYDSDERNAAADHIDEYKGKILYVEEAPKRLKDRFVVKSASVMTLLLDKSDYEGQLSEYCRLWKNFSDLVSERPYLFPEESRNPTTRRINRYLQIGQESCGRG